MPARRFRLLDRLLLAIGHGRCSGNYSVLIYPRRVYSVHILLLQVRLDQSLFTKAYEIQVGHEPRNKHTHCSTKVGSGHRDEGLILSTIFQNAPHEQF